jgi:hypothetical protein
MPVLVESWRATNTLVSRFQIQEHWTLERRVWLTGLCHHVTMDTGALWCWPTTYSMDDAWYHTWSTHRSKQDPFVLSTRKLRVALILLMELVSQCNDCDTPNHFALEAVVSFDTFYRDPVPSG